MTSRQYCNSSFRSALVPNLIVLRVLLDDLPAVLQLLLQVSLGGLEELPTVVPHRVVGGVQFQSILGQRESTQRFLPTFQDCSEIVVDILESVSVSNLYDRIG